MINKGCPFGSHSGGIGLGEIAGIVRCGDRVRLGQALGQLERAIARTDDLDEARGEALTFIAMVTAATLEMGGSRRMHRVQLDAARELDHVHSGAKIVEVSRRYVEAIVANLIDPELTPNQVLIDRALAYIAQYSHRELTDGFMARELGLSTSHFRHLFREATGQPFRKYLMSVRLERARRMLVETDLSIGEIAVEVGFTGMAHFSRAFAQRFNATPSSLRRGGLVVSHHA